MIRFGIILVLASGPIFSCSQEPPVVNTTVGAVLGTIQRSRNGTKFYSFRGIRYAKPPIGELRLKAPVPIEPWNGTFDATEDGPVCLQSDENNTSEDCLRLNVYSKRITEVDHPRPVLFYIHGGGYNAGSGSSKYLGPEYLMDHDIVIVTINYRLGTLGFLSTGDEEAPGNYALKDQVEALRWVQRNIKLFGGDHTRVTISGESAGAASVGFHLLSPMSRGLFHGAILASGGAINNRAITKEPFKTAKIAAEMLKCPTETSKNLIDCLRKVPAEDLAFVFGAGYPPGVSLLPVVEGSRLNDGERFITKPPYQYVKEKDVAHVPLLVGATKDEMLMLAVQMVQNKEEAANVSANWNELLPNMIWYDLNSTECQRIRSFYFGDTNKPITNDSLEALGELYSDSMIIFETVRSAQLISATIPNPVYLYLYSYPGKYSQWYWPGTKDTSYGVLHADDLIYLFTSKTEHPFITATDEEDGPFVDKFTALWATFVETGNPTPQPLEVFDNVVWKLFKPEKPVYLEINRNFTLIEDLYFKDRMSLWNNLFPPGGKI